MSLDSFKDAIGFPTVQVDAANDQLTVLFVGATTHVKAQVLALADRHEVSIVEEVSDISAVESLTVINS